MFKIGKEGYVNHVASVDKSPNSEFGQDHVISAIPGTWIKKRRGTQSKRGNLILALGRRPFDRKLYEGILLAPKGKLQSFSRTSEEQYRKGGKALKTEKYLKK